MSKFLIIFLCVICVISKGQSTKEFKTNFSDTFYNVVVPDLYRSLEDTGNIKVKNWMKQESDKAKFMLSSLPGYKKLHEQYVKSVADSKFESILSVFRLKNEWYAMKVYPGQNNPILYRYDKSGKETLVMNPEQVYNNLGSNNISMREQLDAQWL